MTRALPNRRGEIREATGGSAIYMATQRENDARQGSAVLAWRTANAIMRHSYRERVPVADAMNQLLYAGELR